MFPFQYLYISFIYFNLTTNLPNKTKITFIVFLIFANIFFAQNGGMKISGFVYDSDTNNPIIGANIIITKTKAENDDSFQTGAATGTDGKYVTSKLPTGKYKVTFRNIGYKEKIEIVTISKSSGPLLIDVYLTTTAVEIEEVVVSEVKVTEEIISAVDVSPKMLALLPSISGEIDVFKSLQLLPGVKVASEMSSGIYVRGGSPDQNLTLVDGTMLYNPSHLGNLASTFNTYALNDVKLIKGALHKKVITEVFFNFNDKLKKYLNYKQIIEAERLYEKAYEIFNLLRLSLDFKKNFYKSVV